MDIISRENEDLPENMNSSFTDLFSLLSSCEVPASNMSVLAYSTQNLITMQQCIDHSVNVLLNGMQCMGNLMAAVDGDVMNHISKNRIGQFLSVMCNLIEALNTFSSDAGYEIRQRGVN